MNLKAFEIETSLTPEETHARLRRVIRPPLRWVEYLNNWFPRKLEMPFHGTLDSRAFAVSRIIWYGNSFLPVIRGELIPGPTGTRVRVEMSIPRGAALFVALWFAFLIGVVLLIFAGVAKASPGVLPMVALLLFLGAGLAAICFYPEAKKAERLLRAAMSRAV